MPLIPRSCGRIRPAKHALVYARLDNAPEVSSSEKDFLRALPDSIDLVSMRNAGRLSGFDREDMKLVRTDYGTRVLYYVERFGAKGLNALSLLPLMLYVPERLTV